MQGAAKQAAAGDEKKIRTFWIGTYTFAVASIVNFGAFGFAPASVLAPLESMRELAMRRGVSYADLLAKAEAEGVDLPEE